ncbi:high density lipoprotein binding protein a [Tachysurus fulvidraco]|uniref:high density lipoprotein binding protein a n=1 Tax=Tachysurus fulvidraco TaxID=1234273 RepID=UPI001FEFA4C3|nr:high density lipoprotein binding protein a [Tachysurus fulvidraco]XP_027002520.2 high density lipoprotein binding protein a [Tachysurus fulvidraco]XP_047669488.1 high density lipoprotein binding protein a [Tachysurus fulvidraco]
MSSVAVLTQERFNEHRSGLLPEQGGAAVAGSSEAVDEENLPTYKDAFPPLPEKAASPEGAVEPGNAWTSKIRPLKSSIITQVFHVPLEERKYKDMNQFGEGDQAKVCVDIMHKTGAHLELSMAKDQGLSIMVSGKLDAVMKARKEIVSRLQTQASANVAIPKEHHRFVIGKNGEKLQELELKTATKIQIPRPDDPSNLIKISGTKEGLEKAKHEILLISAEQDKRAVERLNIDKVYHPFITGAYNKVVGEMMQETGARINIPPPSINKTEIVITGEKEQVAVAMAMIKKLYEEKKRNVTTIAVEVKKSQHKYVIGPKGNTLQEILDRTGVSVEIPPPDSSSETVILRGEPDRLGQALTEVYAKANSYTVSHVSAPSWLHRFIIGKKGQNLAKITQQLPKVHIEFTEGEDKIVLEGPTKDIQIVQSQIEAIVTDLVSRMDYTEISVDPKFHRHLIGKGGANINRIKDQYKVSVRIPPDNEKSNLIRIEGDPQGVKEAKKELLELASRMENERTKDMIIEQRFHRAIIGQKGEKIKEIRDKFPEVIINFPDPSHKSDIVQLRGPRTEVEKCTKFMQKMVAEMVENSYSVSVPIFKQFHKNIIGKGGANIKKIREETNTKIDLPAENSNSEMIVITGKKANCEAAKNRILAIQKELANITEVEVSIPAKLHNSLIGSKGRFVRSIMEECGGVHIHFPTEGSGIDAVTIRGPAEEVDKAKKQLLSLAEEKQTKSHTAELRAKPEYHKFLIGKGGGNIRKVRDSTGARIIFPTPEDKDQELITVIGTEEAVAEAQKELEALIKSLDNVVEDNLSVDPKHHRFFVARRGQVLREIADEYGGVMVSFPRTGSQTDKVTLKGAKDCVEAAKKRMLEIVEDLDAQVTMECVIPQKFHRSIMGPKGARIQQITRDHNVQIKFPEREDAQASQTEAQVQENGEANGEMKENTDPAAPKKCDVIVLSGRKERCEAAVEALKALVPVSIEVEVPFELHRYIIGQKGSGIRKMMDEFEVNIQVPAPELQSDIISITGLATHLDRAKEGLLERVKDLQAEQEDRALRSFKLTITVDPKYHPKIIGRKGAIITQIRTDHDVNIQFPEKNDENQDQINITGYEQNAIAARDAIQAIVDELEEMISEDITLDSRVHARIIGARGKGIRKIMDEFKVDLRFPQSGSADPNLVTVTGRPEMVDEAIDHLLNLEEEYMADVVENEAKMAYMKPSGTAAANTEEPRGPSKGFVVREAPWATSNEKAPDMSSSEDFPSFGAPVAAARSSPWGPKRF